MEAALLGMERGAPANTAQSGLAGLVRVGVTEGFGTLVLAPQLAQLTRQHPRLSIDLLAVLCMMILCRRLAYIVI